MNTEPMRSGWSWLCPCGWGTGKHAGLEVVERQRAGHLRKHAADRQQAEAQRA